MAHLLAAGRGRLRLFLLTVLLLSGAVACDLLKRLWRVEADVRCSTALAGVSCEVTRRSGRGAAQVCWDMEFTCANGRVMTGHACHTVPVGSEPATMEVIPWSALTHASLCDRVSTMRIANVAVQVGS